jgi:L1 cell adhesion molecule like protein
VFEVLSTSGDTHLGGDDFDKKVVDWLVANFKRDEGIDLSKDRKAMQRLTEAAVKAKEELSSVTQTAINLPFITATAEGPKHIDASLSRAKFEALCEELFERCRGPVRRAIEDAKLSVDAIKEVVLVGGSTRIPRVQALVRELTGGKEPNLTVNPDEVVALGAAVQAGVLSGEVEKIVLLDVTPLSLGVETLGGVMTKLIPRNTTLPTTKSETFSTAADSQTSVDVHVLQGEREFARDNKSLGNFKLEGIPPAPRGVPQVEVTFDISADGILRVSARDKASGKRADISITGASTLSADDVAAATRDAERHAAEDRARRALVDARNEAESMLYQSGRQIKEFGDKVSADVKNRVQAAADALQAAAAGEDVAAIRAAIDALREASTAIGQAMYGGGGAAAAGPQQQPGGGGGDGGGPAAGSGKSEPGVYDAEFTDST